MTPEQAVQKALAGESCSLSRSDKGAATVELYRLATEAAMQWSDQRAAEQLARHGRKAADNLAADTYGPCRLVANGSGGFDKTQDPGDPQSGLERAVKFYRAVCDRPSNDAATTPASAPLAHARKPLAGRSLAAPTTPLRRVSLRHPQPNDPPREAWPYPNAADDIEQADNLAFINAHRRARDQTLETA
ncbi:MAG: hypothetical protein AAGA29_04965 [Planctomycetota bacterium]